MTNNLPPAISQPSFNIVRVTWETPSRVISAINKVKANRPDLNIEVVDPYNFFRLAKQTLPVPSADTLLPGQAMSLDSSIYSANGKFRLTYQSNGNVVIYRTADGFVKAQTGTDGHTPTWFGLQSDGNLVLYTEEAGAIFHTVTGEKGVTKAVLQNDGNLVLYAGNTPLWTSSIPINSGDHLYPGEAVYSPNCNYYFVHQDGGNVVIYRTSDWSWIWQSYTQGQTTTHAVLQGDGNLVLYNGGTVITSTQTTGKGAVTATMQDDGNFVLRKSDGTAVWSTQGGMVP